MTPEQKQYLESLAKRKCWCDDSESIINDFAGGNIDDAYSGGYDDGQATLARELLGLDQGTVSKERT